MIAPRRRYVARRGPGIIHEVTALAHHAAQAAAHAAAIAAHHMEAAQGRERDYERRRDTQRELAHPKQGGRGLPWDETTYVMRQSDRARRRPR